jgi:hypothetical protein
MPITKPMPPGDTEVGCPGCGWTGIIRECVMPMDDVIRCPHCEAPVEIQIEE